MRRKSTRNAQKATPDKAVKEAESPPKTRRSRRRKRSPSKSTDSEEEVMTSTKRLSPEETPDTTTKSHTPTDEETLEEPVWKVTPTDDDPPKGEIQKLKICLTRPSPDSPDKTKTRRSKSNSQTEDEATEDKPTRRTRSRGSPIVKNDGLSSQEGDEEMEDKKGKGKSKGKHKSKIEKSPHLSEPEIQTNNEISENVQVTPQSPTIDKPVDNENDYNKVDANNIQKNDETDQKTEIIKEDKEPQTVDVHHSEKKDSDDDEPLSILQKTTTNTNKLSDSTESTEIASNVTEEQSKITQEETEEDTVKTETESQITKSTEEQPPETKIETPPHLPEDIEMKTVEEKSVVEEETTIEKEKPIETTETSASELVNTSETEEENVVQKSKDVEVDDSQSVELQQEASKAETDSENQPQEPEKATEIQEPAVVARSPKHWLRRDSVYLKQDYQEKDSTNESFIIKPSKVTDDWEKATDYPSLVKVDLESIQVIWPTIDFPEEPDLTLEVAKERRKSLGETSGKKLERKVSVDYKSDFSERPSYDKQSSVNSTTQDSEDNSNIIAFNRKISIVDDTASKLKPPPSPAKNPLSNILFITNLVRPFTVKQLKELLERTGRIQEEGFWTDRIKSKCYVQYETQEEAEATRNALHGVQWPIGNGKKLIIDYSTEDDMNNAKNPPAPPPVAPVQDVKAPVKENLEPIENKPRIEEKHVKEVERKRVDGPIREWDIGKKDVRKDRSRSRERSRKHKRSPSPSEDFISRKQRKEEESVPQKLMDDLFLKTKATPSIYWQPLSPEEIAMKQQQRLIRMEEHKRRLEESSRMKAREMGRGAFRRRYD